MRDGISHHNSHVIIFERAGSSKKPHGGERVLEEGGRSSLPKADQRFDGRQSFPLRLGGQADVDDLKCKLSLSVRLREIYQKGKNAPSRRMCDAPCITPESRPCNVLQAKQAPE